MVFLVSVVYIAAIIAASASVAVLLLKGKSMPYNKWYIACQGMVIIWCVSQIWILLSASDCQLWGAYCAGNVGVCFIGACWLVFAIEYTESRGKQIFALKAGAFLISVFHYVMMLTNAAHHWYYPVFSREQVTHGVLFYTNVTATYLFVIIGAVVLYRSFRGEKSGSMGRACIIAAVLVPVFLNCFYISGFLPVRYDITPMGFAFSGIFVLLATIKYRFMEINVAAFDKVVSDLEDGVAIFGESGEVIFSNSAFTSLLGMENPQTYDAVWGQLGTAQIEEDGMLSLGRESHLQLQLYQGDGQNFTAVRTPLGEDAAKAADRTETEGRVETEGRTEAEGRVEAENRDEAEDGRKRTKVYVLVVKDMQNYYELLKRTRSLAVADQKLALEKERNRIAGQVHDTVGHTLTMLQSYMKLAMVDLEKDEFGSLKEYLLQARELTAGGIKELRESINRMKREEESELVTQTVLRLAAEVKEIPVEVTVQGTEDERYLPLSLTVHDCVRESITNMLKYAAASEMEIVLRFQETKLELVMADNGAGCEMIVDSQGLRGIRERVEKLNGSVRFSSEPGQGFLTVLMFPVEGGVQKEEDI